MIDSIEEAQEVATALLATVKKLMTGSEIAACEWTRNPSFDDEINRNAFDIRRTSSRFIRDEEKNPEMRPWHTIVRLETTFSREIGDWINKRNMARARRATKLSGVE